MQQRGRPTSITEYETEHIGDDIYRITAPPKGFQQYLVLGQERALLIDSGFGWGSLKKVVEELTRLPVVLVNTHGHPDHCGGNAEFGTAWLYPDDNELCERKCSFEARLDEAMHWELEQAQQMLQPTPPAPAALADGQVFDLGGRKLIVIHIPGHSRGSVCLFEEQTGTLFAGDNVQGFATALTEECAANVSVYLQSMEKLAALPIRRVCSGHMPAVLPPDLIGKKIRCARRILSGEPGDWVKTRMGECYEMTEEGTSICYIPEKAH